MHGAEKGQFSNGQSGYPAGTPRGSCDKLAARFISELYADWIANGAAVIEQVRIEQPAAYLKIVASLFPKQLVEAEHDIFDGVSDEELEACMAYVRNALRTAEGGDGGPDSAAH